MDTQGEKLERRLDALINRKTFPSGSEWDPVITDWTSYKNLIGQTEKALADAIAVSNV